MARRFDPDPDGNLARQMAELAGLAGTINELHKSLGGRKDHAILDENGEVIAFSVYHEDGALDLDKLLEWAAWFERNPYQRSIERTEVGEHAVSTVFLGLDHQYMPKAKPFWFETMVFGPPHEETMASSGKKYMARPSLWTYRTSTKAQAIAAHQDGIKWLENYLLQKSSSPTSTNPE